jgi:P27 family predicted phage terminase small subunit
MEAKQGFPGRRKTRTKAEVAAIARDAAAGDQAAAPEGEAPSRVPAAPEWLDAEGRRVWAILGDDLVRRQIMRAGDLNAFARYCDDCSVWLRLRKETRTPSGRLKVTYTTFTAAGGERRYKNPSYELMLQLSLRLKDYEDRFGLNPQARTQLLIKRASTLGQGKPPPEAPPKAGEPGATGPKPGSPLGILNTKRLN